MHLIPKVTESLFLGSVPLPLGDILKRQLVKRKKRTPF